MNYGLLTLVPAILVILTAIVSRKTTEALMIGVLFSYLIIGGISDFVPLMTEAFFKVVTDYDTMWLIFVCGLFGSLIALINKSRGTHAIARSLGKICKTGKSTLLVSWLLGIIIFVDDYMNILTISACTKRLSDKRKIPREALAYVIDSTGAPVCVLVPFSTWSIFFASVFWEQESIQALGYNTALETYIHSIPYMFYAIVTLVVVLLFILALLPKVGAMKKAYDRVDMTGEVYSKESRKLNKYDNDEADETASVWDFVIPIATMIIVQLVFDDMFWAVIASILMCAVIYIPRRKIKMNDFCDLWIQGFAEAVPALAIIIFALLMRQASSDINLPNYVVSMVEPFVNAQLFPVITFMIVAVLGFITGSNWGIPAVCVPILIPLGAVAGANLLLVMAAIVSGGTFCSHACFYSDATVITSNTCGIENMDHVYSQLPYAIISFGVSCIAFLVFGFI